MMIIKICVLMFFLSCAAHEWYEQSALYDHVSQKGETLSSVAENLLGSPDVWDEIEFKGDKKYGAEEILPAGTKLSVPSYNSDLRLEGDQAKEFFESHPLPGDSKRRLGNPTKNIRFWNPDGVANPKIPYTIKSGCDYYSKRAFLLAKAMIEKETCASLVPRTNEVSYIEVGSDKGGCFVNCLGKCRRKITYNLRAPGCTGRGTAVHEIAHIIGMQHEQTRQDRDKYVRVRFDRIAKEHHRQFSIDPLRGTLPGFKYDYDSVMHYSRQAFQKRPEFFGKDTIEVIGDPTITIGRKNGLSAGDILALNVLLACPGAPSPALRPTRLPTRRRTRLPTRRPTLPQPGVKPGVQSGVQSGVQPGVQPCP